MGNSPTDHRTFKPAEIVNLITPAGYRPTYSRKYPIFEAIQVDDDLEKGANIVKLQYEDQNFALHATTWEKFYAQPLVGRNGKPFHPIVTKAGLIIGYCGQVPGGHVWSQDEIDPEMEWTEFEGLDITAHFAALNAAEAKAKKALGWTTLRKWSHFVIVCSVDGEVLNLLGEIDKGSEVESEGIGPIELVLDLISGAIVIKSVGKGLVKRAIGIGWKEGFRSLVRRIGSAIGRKFGRKPGDVLARKLKKSTGKIGVNLGGTGEVKDYINVNNLTGGQTKGVPNLLERNAEDVGSLFSPGTVDDIRANNIVSGSFDWPKVAAGSHKVLKDGGTVAFTEFGGGLKRGLDIKAALEAVGFKDVRVFSGHVTGIKK